MHVSMLTRIRRVEGWVGAKTRFGGLHFCVVCRPTGSKQVLTKTRAPGRGRAQRAFAAALMRIIRHECGNRQTWQMR